MSFIASVVIPARGRSAELDRAIQSIVACKASDLVEIIVVDDFSPEAIVCKVRDQDRIIRLEKQSGAAVARNVGIDAAQGDVIYLLDSDDYVLRRDFASDHAIVSAAGCNVLWFDGIDSQGFSSAYPQRVEFAEFFPFIFFQQPNICQTSSLYFLKKCGLRFDESLPKHQDWDFVFTALESGMVVRHGAGRIFFDRSDRGSLSRVPNPERSRPWLSKLSDLLSSGRVSSAVIDLEMTRYHLFGRYRSEVSWLNFLRTSVYFLFGQKTSPRRLMVATYYRLFSKV